MISYVYRHHLQYLGAMLMKDYSKYQFMEVNNQRRAAGLKDKIPDIEKSLEAVRFMKRQEV
jgi:hypothetical protein